MEEKKVELLGRDNPLMIGFRWPAGPYLGRFLLELKEKGRLWGIRCPGCGRLLLPPRIVCATCYTKIPEFPEGWIELSGKGKLLEWEKIIYPQMNPETGKVKPEPYLHATFVLDEGVLFVHYLGPEDMDERKLREGMRVEMVMKPLREREGKVTDIKYFRIVEG